jgi:hypothetical protein
MERNIKHLQEDQYYIDLYDLMTVEECLRCRRSIKENLEKKRNSAELKKLTKEEFDREVCRAENIIIFTIKLNRYKNKAETIQLWKSKDRQTQQRYDQAVPPSGIVCNKCYAKTEVISKNLMGSFENQQMLFMFECLKCKKRKGVLENGVEWQHDFKKCPQCYKPLNEKFKKTKTTLIINYSCSGCSYKERDVMDFDRDEKEWVAKKNRETKLLGEFRKEFCFDDAMGTDAVVHMNQFNTFMKKHEDRENNKALYEKVKELKRPTFAQLEKLLVISLETNGYVGLRFGKPEMGKHVVVDFSVNDAKDGRPDYESQKDLKKLIKTVLADTNWRLINDSICYRLGILEGRVKAYELEEDLLELVKQPTRKGR